MKKTKQSDSSQPVDLKAESNASSNAGIPTASSTSTTEKPREATITLAQPKRLAWQMTLIRFSEGFVWVIVIALIFIFRSITKNVFNDITAVWLIGLIIAFALLYYTVIYQNFNTKQRRYIKDMADIIFIGILGSVAKDYSVYLFSLYILPVASAAFALDTINSLMMATIASVFIAANIVLNSTGFGHIDVYYYGSFQIALLIIMTIFTRALALQLRNEQEERQYFAEELRRADQKLHDIEAIEQEFVSITTHQLNTPLSIIRGYTSMLLAGDAGKLTTKQGRYVREVHTGSLRLMKIIQDLLGIAHLDRDEYLAHYHRPVDVANLIEGIIGLLQSKAAENNIALTYELPKTKLIILGNETHLAEAIKNLIDNAIKYSDKGKEVLVLAQKEKSQTGNDVVISVIDEGIGIPEDEQRNIFQRFYRASNSKPKDPNGTGLGLYIVKRIAEYHAGSVSFRSNPHGGTTFRVRLPLVTLSDDRK